MLADELPASSTTHEIYLPLVQFSALLLIPVEKDKSGNFVATVSSTEQTFSVNPATHRMVIDGVSSLLRPGDARLADGDVYVSSALLDKLVPLDIRLRQAGLVKVSSKQPLPIEVRQRQEQLRLRISPSAAADRTSPTTRSSAPMSPT